MALLSQCHYYGEDFRVYKNEPEVFKIADQKVAEEVKDNPRVLPNGKYQYEIPVPFLHVPENKKKGPVIVTNDWYVQKKKDWVAKVSKEKRVLQEEMMDCLTDKDIIKEKLSRLDPSKPKNKKKIIKLNMKIRDIDAELQMLSQQCEKPVQQMERGSRFDRFISKIKRCFHWVGNKIKKFVKKYSYIIQPVAIVVGALLSKALVAKTLALFA